jgi:hypothetical protein
MRANADLLELTAKVKADVFFAYSRGSIFGFGTISIWDPGDARREGGRSFRRTRLLLRQPHSCSHERRAVAAA